ncbi:MAG: DUF2281 domain-containing protein [Pseudomonadota bacterium]
METDKLSYEISSLPPAAQKQVKDFIAFLRDRYAKQAKPKSKRAADIASQSFIGIWKDREDMKDRTGWVRSARKTEWSEPGA